MCKFTEMLKNNIDFSKMCRLCTKSNLLLHSLYDNDNDGVAPIVKLKILCGLEVSDNDSFPKSICKTCQKKLKNCYEFRSMCISSQETLTNYSLRNEQMPNLVATNDVPFIEPREEIRYFIEVEEDVTINELDLLHSDIEQYFSNVNKNTTNNITRKSYKNVVKVTKRKVEQKKCLNRTAKSDGHDPNKKHKCKVCKKRFGSELRVKLHMQRIHKQIYLAECNVVCPKCGMKFQQTRNLKRHLVYHNTDSYFRCEFCDKKSYSKKSWRKHIKIHEEKINTICKICNKTIYSKLSFIYHMDYHHTKEVLATKTFYTCLTCQTDFVQFTELEKHCVDRHSLKTPEEHNYLTNNSDETSEINASITFKCNICSRLYKNLLDLNSHVIECYAKVNRPKSFMCDVCGKCFASSWTLTNHKAGHSSARPFICDICGQCFKWHNDLTNHKSRIHEQLRPYVCKICGKRCGTSATLKSHMRLHTGEKPYVCKHCNAKFAQNSSLKEHMFKHTGGQEGTCPICNKVFKTSLRLRTHIKRHNTQRKLFPCDLCGRMFTEKTSVRKHKLKIHNDIETNM